MSVTRLFYCGTLVALLGACGSQVSNNDVSIEPSTLFQISSDSIENGLAAEFMVFDVEIVENLITTGSTTTITTPAPLSEQQEDITNPTVQITAAPDEAVAYAFFVEGVGDTLTNCNDRNTGLAPPVGTRCLHWGLLNATFDEAGFANRTVPTSLATDAVTTSGATLLNVPYLFSQGGTYGVTTNFAGIAPPSGTAPYRLVGYALSRKLDLTIDPLANPNRKHDSDVLSISTTDDFVELFGSSGLNIIIASSNPIIFNVRGKVFTIENDDGTFENDTVLSNRVITCGGVAGAGDSPFDNPGQSPQLVWNNAPLSTNSFVLFMMDDSSLEQAGASFTFLGDGDSSGGTTNEVSVSISETSESTQTTNYEPNCDFEFCRHWAVFNIPSSIREVARGEDFSGMGGVIQGKHLYHGAYAVQQQPLVEREQFDVTVGETLTYTTNRGTLSITSDGVTADDGMTNVATNAAAVNTTNEVANETRRYFGPCAPVNSTNIATARQYSVTILPVRQELTDWIAANDDNARFIQRLSLNNFLYYFSPNASDRRRKRPGCPRVSSENMDACQDDAGETTNTPYPNRADFLASLSGGGDPTVAYVIHARGASTTFYHADDDCELCRFCLIGYDAATPQVPLNAWQQFGHTN